VAQTHASDGGRSGRLAEEQAALRRVAAAHGAEPSSLFALVAEKVSRVLHVPFVSVVRFEDDRIATERASVPPEGALFAVGRRWSLVGTSVLSEMRASGRTARIDDYARMEGEIAEECRRVGIRSTVGIPVAVRGRTWGAMVVSSTDAEPLPADTEERLADFTALLATAIANSEAQAEVARLAEEQAALRRVATLVAQGVPSDALFGAVCDEVEALAGAEASALLRFEADGTATLMGNRSQRAAGSSRHPHRPAPVGARLELDPDGVLAEVHRTGRTARFDTDDPAAPGMPEVIRTERLRSTLASPIVVEGELWGAITTGSRERPLPAGMERRLADFTELVATAIANLQARAELAASRARIAAAADDERRRVVRDLHDGAQQRLVHTIITLKLARRALQSEQEDAPALLTEALENAEQATAELRELAHGILPTALTRGGLSAGVDVLASRMPMPIENGVAVGRLPAAVEATAYFVVAEALTNVAKHSSAEHAEVVARIEDGTLRVEVRDDGVGGASPNGTGLVGLADRLAVFDGRLEVDSPPGAGTRLTAAIPLPRSDRSASA
jgi:signal transduction histidine kinase